MCMYVCMYVELSSDNSTIAIKHQLHTACFKIGATSVLNSIYCVPNEVGLQYKLSKLQRIQSELIFLLTTITNACYK